MNDRDLLAIMTAILAGQDSLRTTDPKQCAADALELAKQILEFIGEPK